MSVHFPMASVHRVVEDHPHLARAPAHRGFAPARNPDFAESMSKLSRLPCQRNGKFSAPPAVRAGQGADRATGQLRMGKYPSAREAPQLSWRARTPTSHRCASNDWRIGHARLIEGAAAAIARGARRSLFEPRISSRKRSAPRSAPTRFHASRGAQRRGTEIPRNARCPASVGCAVMREEVDLRRLVGNK